MIRLIIFLSLFLSSFAFARKEPKNENLFEIEFTHFNIKKNHKYTLVKSKSKHTLVFQDGYKKVRKRPVSERQAQLMISVATQIFWESKYRRPSSIKKCVDYYVIVRFNKQRSEVCRQHTKLVGRSYGFLNSLRNLF